MVIAVDFIGTRGMVGMVSFVCLLASDSQTPGGIVNLLLVFTRFVSALLFLQMTFV